MKASADYTLYHPRWYRRRISVWWWLQKRSYLLFVLRELTSVFVALFAAVLLWELAALRAGAGAYAHVLARLQTPVFVAFHAVSFVFVVVHAITWFLLTPQAMIVRVGGRRLPDALIVAANFVAWVVLSIGVAWLILRR
ncbi:MAG: fumarate reductase subunit C [Candidatus Methylomirabilales bacterium]